MSEIVEAGGSLVYVLLGMGGVGLLAICVLAGLAFSQRRVPLAVWVTIPLLVAGIGALASWSNAMSVFTEVSAAQPELVASTALEGLWSALTADWLSRWVAAVLFACATWAAAVGSAISPGPDRLYTVGAAVMAFVLTLVGAIGCGAYAYMHNLGNEAYALAALVGFAGTGVAVAATQRSIEDEHMYRVAGMRFAASICMLMSISFAGRAVAIGNRMAVFGQGGVGVENLELAVSIQKWADIAAPVTTVAWIAFAAALAIAWFGFIAELGEVVQRFTLIDVVVTLTLIGCLGGARLIEHSQTDGLFAIGTHGPATALYDRFGAELPAAIVSYDKEPNEVAPANGGFSDVFVYETVILEEAVLDPETREISKPAVTEDRWNRRYKRVTNGWDEEETDFRTITDVPAWPLIVMEGAREASLVAEVLAKAPEGKGFLLLRAAEVKGDVVVPRDLAHKRVTFLPIRLQTADPDFTTEIYADSGARQIYWGPIQYFGETDGERESLKYLAGVVKDTEAKVLHQLFDERTRIKSVVALCLPWMAEIQGDATVITDRTCTMAEGELADWQAKAREVWEKPEAANVRVASARVTGGAVDGGELNEQLSWQMGAIQHCFDTVSQEPGLDERKLRDRLAIDVWVRQTGSVSAITLADRNRQELPALQRCVGNRLRQLRFTEIPPPPPPEDPSAELPVPDQRSVTVQLDFRP